LNEEAIAEWSRIGEELRRLHLLTVADTKPLAAYCASYARWAAAERALKVMAERDPLTKGLMVKGSLGNPVQNPLVKVAAAAARDMGPLCRRIRTYPRRPRSHCRRAEPA
jgi:P27 family predicted phage terminase small subunit